MRTLLFCNIKLRTRTPSLSRIDKLIKFSCLKYVAENFDRNKLKKSSVPDQIAEILYMKLPRNLRRFSFTFACDSLTLLHSPYRISLPINNCAELW